MAELDGRKRIHGTDLAERIRWRWARPDRKPNPARRNDFLDRTENYNAATQLVSDKSRVYKGGSWKDVAYYLQVSSRDYEVDTIQRSYIGFRTVQDYMGTDVTANQATN